LEDLGQHSNVWNEQGFIFGGIRKKNPPSSSVSKVGTSLAQYSDISAGMSTPDIIDFFNCSKQGLGNPYSK
jgi:hypothetical protein